MFFIKLSLPEFTSSVSTPFSGLNFQPDTIVFTSKLSKFWGCLQTLFFPECSKNKEHIDSLSYEQLLKQWRYAPFGDEWFQGVTGVYWGERMQELRAQSGGQEEHVRASKIIGWD